MGIIFPWGEKQKLSPVGEGYGMGLHEVYVGTITKGIYYTSNFLNSPQPIWSTVNTGLTSLKMYQLLLDAFNPRQVQFCLTNDTTEVFRRVNKGNWQSILTKTDVAAGVDRIEWIWSDLSVQNRLYAVSDDSFTAHYLSTSNDNGDTWTHTTLPTGVNPRQIYQIWSNGNRMWITFSIGVSTTHYVAISNNAGAAWNISVANLGNSAFTDFFSVPVLTQDKIYTGKRISPTDFELTEVDNALVFTTKQPLQYLFSGLRPDAMWHSASAIDTQRIIKGSRIYSTQDNWVTLDNPAPALIVPTIHSQQTPFSSENEIVVGSRSPDINNPHTVLQMTTITGVPQGKSGSDPQNPLTTVSIPYTCDGICYNGIQFVS